MLLIEDVFYLHSICGIFVRSKKNTFFEDSKFYMFIYVIKLFVGSEL